MRRKRINFRMLFTKIGLISILAAFTQCASSQMVDKTAPTELSDPYFENWVSGVRGGGSGFMVYLPVDENSDIQLEKVYFKGKMLKLERKSKEAVYVGRYKDPSTVEKDFVMSGDSKKEFKNEVPEIEEKIPFKLNEGECVVAYSKNGKKGYFKIDNLPEKKLKAYPMQPRQ